MQRKGIDAFWLKIIAIIGMTSDHIGNVFGNETFFPGLMPIAVKTALFFPGGLTFPIMAYLLVEGYKKTSNLKRYMGRLLIFALIALPIFMWAFTWTSLNILFTLLLGLVVMYLYDHMKSRPLFYVVFAGITIATFMFDWGLIGIPIIFCMYAIQGEKKRIIIPLAAIPGSMVLFYGIVGIFGYVTGIGGMAWPEFAFFIGSLCAIPLLLNYNGQRGRNMKYLFYAFYPAHLLILGVLRGIITGVWFPWG